MTTAPAETVDHAAEHLRRAKSEYALMTRTRPVYDFPYRAVVAITGPDHVATFDAATDWMGTLDGLRDRDSLISGRHLIDAALIASRSDDKPGAVRAMLMRTLRSDPDLLGVRSATLAAADAYVDMAVTGHAVVISSETDILDHDMAAKYGAVVTTLADIPQIPARLLLGDAPGLTITGPGQVRLAFQSGTAQFFDEAKDQFIAVTTADITLAVDADGVLDPSASSMTLTGRVIKESNWRPGKRRAEVTDLGLSWLPGAAWRVLIEKAAETGVTVTEDAYVIATTGGTR